MELTIKGTPEEIAALVAAIQERRGNINLIQKSLEPGLLNQLARLCEQTDDEAEKETPD